MQFFFSSRVLRAVDCKGWPFQEFLPFYQIMVCEQNELELCPFYSKEIKNANFGSKHTIELCFFFGLYQMLDKKVK